MVPSEQCCFMVGTLQRESLWLESSIKATCLKESSRKKGRGGGRIEVPPKLRGDMGYEDIDFRQS